MYKLYICCTWSPQCTQTNAHKICHSHNTNRLLQLLCTNPSARNINHTASNLRHFYCMLEMVKVKRLLYVTARCLMLGQ
jgi:hypothetical protein